MNVQIDRAIDEIDAAVFSGDIFQERYNREELKRFIAKWLREIEQIEEFWESDENED